MSGAPTFDAEKKQKWGKFITPPRPTARRNNKYTELHSSQRRLDKQLPSCHVSPRPIRSLYISHRVLKYIRAKKLTFDLKSIEKMKALTCGGTTTKGLVIGAKMW